MGELLHECVEHPLGPVALGLEPGPLTTPELLGPLAPAGGTVPAGDAQADIQQALLALGYNEREAAAALKALPADVGVSDGIRLALKALTR